MQKELSGRDREDQDVTPLVEGPPVGVNVEDSAAVDIPDHTGCSGCGEVVGGEYFLLNDTTWCHSCKEELMRQTRITFGKLFKSCFAGYLGALVAGGLWALVTIVTGYQVGLIAVFVGLIVGHAVRWGAKPATGRRFQILAVLLTFLGLSYSTIPVLVKEFKENPDYLKELKEGWEKGVTEAESQAAVSGESVSIAGENSAEENVTGSGPESEAKEGTTETESVVAAVTAEVEEAVPGDAKAAEGSDDGDANPVIALLMGLALLGVVLLAVVFVAPPVIYVVYLFGDPLSLLFLAIALWQAWRLNTPIATKFEGPIQGSEDLDFSKAEYEAP